MIRRINDLCLFTVVVSNQPGIAKGRFAERHLEAVTAHMIRELAGQSARLDAVYYRLHHPEAMKTELRTACDCRKLRPGLSRRGGQELAIDPTRSYMVGDDVTDIRALGCPTFGIGRPGSDTCLALKEADVMPDFVVSSLLAAVDIIAAREQAGADCTALFRAEP